MQCIENDIIRTYNKLQISLSITEKEYRMKYALLDTTDPEEIREKLNTFLNNSPYNQERLYQELTKKFPTMNWSYRQLNSMLNDSVNIDLTKVNQICRILFPVKQINEISIDTIYEEIEEISEKIRTFNDLLKSSLKNDKTIDEKEFNVLKSYKPIIENDLKNFIDVINSVVNVPLQTI